MTKRSLVLAMSVDTEEDQWGPTSAPPTLRNLRALPRLHSFLGELGARPTYFVNYPAASDADGVRILREIAASGSAEIGAHLHTWNTPPLDEHPDAAPSMMYRLPVPVQAAKVAAVTEALAHAFGTAPSAFRAGRFGFGPTTAQVLLGAGYTVDSSVTPFVDWERYDDGPAFVGAPLDVYRLGSGDVIRHDPAGRLVEVPVSAGFTGGPVSSWSTLVRLRRWRVGRRSPVAVVTERFGLAREVVLSPELCSTRDMLRLARRIVASGCRFLQMFWHSPSLTPGLTPFTPSALDVERVYTSIAEVVAALGDFAEIRFATVTEAAELLAPPRRADPEEAAAC